MRISYLLGFIRSRLQGGMAFLNLKLMKDINSEVKLLFSNKE